MAKNGKGRKIRKGSRKKDTVNYTLCKGDKRVYEGITFIDRKQERITEHRRGGKDFDKMCCDKPLTRKESYDIERKRIERFKPPYNDQYTSGKVE